jgi:hypothetical protein
MQKRNLGTGSLQIAQLISGGDISGWIINENNHFD